MPRIEEVPWHTLHHAYGTCEPFPDVIQKLASADPKERAGARHWLEELLFHQGTHYPANEFAVPFLLQTAANPDLPERERFLEFLNRFLANAKPPISPGQRARLTKKLQMQFQFSLGEGSERWRDYRNRSLAAAWNCRDLLADVLKNDPLPAARCWAAFILASLVRTGRINGGGWLEEKPTSWFTATAAAAILNLLHDRAMADPSQEVRVSATFGIGYLRDEPGAKESLIDLFTQTSEPVRLAAAAARLVVESPIPKDVAARVVNGVVKNLLPGQRTGWLPIFDPDHPLAVAYDKLGLPLQEGSTAETPPRPKPFASVPFARLPAWLNASRDEHLPLPELVEDALKDATPSQRIRAVRLLGSIKLPQPSIVHFLKRLLSHADPVVSMAASVALFRRKRNSPAAPLIEVFRQPLQSRNAKLRQLAVKSLLSMGSMESNGPIPSALPWVVEAARHEKDLKCQKLMCGLFARAATEDRTPSKAFKGAQKIATKWLADPAIQGAALTALGDMHERSIPVIALEPLVALLNSSHPSRCAVPGRLARIRSDRVLPIFLETLSKETDPEVHKAIGWALSKLRKPARVVDETLKAVRNGSIAVDGPLGQALVLLSPKLPAEKRSEVAAVVLEALQSPRTAADREKLAEVAGWLTIESESVIDALMKLALTDPEGRVRSTAAHALICSKVPVDLLLPRAIRVAEQGDDAALDGLHKLLDHGNTPVMPGLARSLLPSLKHSNYWRRQKTVSALKRMAANDEDVERAVLRRLKDEHVSVRHEATKYVFKCLSNDEVVPSLLEALRDEPPSIYAWWNLKSLGKYTEYKQVRATPAELLPIAEHLLATQTGLFVNDICQWLQEQGPTVSAIVPRLLTLLDDPSPKARFAKIEALLAIDPSQKKAALNALEPMLTHKLDAVRAYAEKLREKID